MVDTRITRGTAAENGQKPKGYLDAWDLNDYYLFFLSEVSNRVNNEFIFTEDFEPVKKIIKEAPEEKKEDWDTFKAYFKETSSKIYKRVKNHQRLMKFFFSQINKELKIMT